MKAAVLKERFPDERRVALLPDNVKKLQAAGYEILIERGAGLGSSITDEDYSAGGINGFSYVGNYAIRIQFSDGHSTGIFSWDYLWKIADEKDEE